MTDKTKKQTDVPQKNRSRAAPKKRTATQRIQDKNGS